MNNEPPRNNIRVSTIVFESQLKPGQEIDNETLVIPDIPTDKRDMALGQYMDCFSHLEGSLRILLWKLMQTDRQTSTTVFSQLGMKQITSLLIAIGRQVLKDADQRSLDSLCDRVSRCSTKRNLVVHGQWIPNIVIGSKDGRPVVNSVEWVRSYMPPDPLIARKAMDVRNQKLNTKYHFTIPRLRQACKDLISLSEDVSSFRASLEYLPEPPYAQKVGRSLQ